MSEDEADETERREAEALARALEGELPGEHAPHLPEDALATAALLRHGGARGELSEDRAGAVLKALLGELPARGTVAAKPARVVRLVPIAALATPEVSKDALRTAAARGALQATKGPDSQWRSCRNWVDEYTKTRYKKKQ